MSKRKKFWMLVLIAAMMFISLACNEYQDEDGVWHGGNGSVTINTDPTTYNLEEAKPISGEGGIMGWVNEQIRK